MENKLLGAGTDAAGFCLQDADEKEVCLSDFKGKWVVLYFYPKDNTPGCTVEAMDFSKLKDDFEKENAVILGVSKDSCKSHQNFIDRMGLTIKLLSDPDSAVQKLYGVWKPKKLMGREFFGTIRTTFLVAPDGKISHSWFKVSAMGHAGKVLEKLKEIKQ